MFPRGLLVLKGETHDFSPRIYKPQGGEAVNCGSGREQRRLMGLPSPSLLAANQPPMAAVSSFSLGDSGPALRELLRKNDCLR